MPSTMPRPSRLKLPPLDLGQDTVGRRLARLRKERGYTQQELAESIGIIQALVSDYERDKLRLNADMLTRFALALEVSADELLGLRDLPKNGKKTSRKVLRRMERIEDLPPHQQTLILKTIDTLLKGATA